VVAGCRNAAEDLAHFRFVVDKLQQRLAAGALTANAEDVFSRRIQVDDQQVLIQEDDARIQAIEDIA
jgi:hypothetical protein